MIVLSDRADEHARVRVFEHDGDVMTKPFSYPELRGRIRALLRRSHNQQNRQVVRIGTLRVDLASREVHVDGRPVALTGKEGVRPAGCAGQGTDPSDDEGGTATRGVGVCDADQNARLARSSSAPQAERGRRRPAAGAERVGRRLPAVQLLARGHGGMRPPTPLEACMQIAGEHAANTLAAIEEQRAARLVGRLEEDGQAVTEFADEDGEAKTPQAWRENR